MSDEKYFHIPYYEWQTKLETNCKWSSDEVEKMFGELMEQYIKRLDADEKITALIDRQMVDARVIVQLEKQIEQLERKCFEDSGV